MKSKNNGSVRKETKNVPTGQLCEARRPHPTRGRPRRRARGRGVWLRCPRPSPRALSRVEVVRSSRAPRQEPAVLSGLRRLRGRPIGSSAETPVSLSFHRASLECRVVSGPRGAHLPCWSYNLSKKTKAGVIYVIKEQFIPKTVTSLR